MSKAKVKKPLPFEFVLELLDRAKPYTKPMFGAHSVYVDEKIVLILYESAKSPHDVGVWLATTGEHHAELKTLLPSMRSLEIFGPGPTGWQVLPATSPNFESEVERACALILKGSPLIGKTPKRKRVPKTKKAKRS